MAQKTAGAPSQVSVKTVLTICFTVLGVCGLAAFIVEARAAIWLTIAAALLATALHHLVDLFTRHRVRRGWALAITLVVFVVAIVGVLMLLLPPAIRQATALVSAVPSYLMAVRHSSLYQGLESRYQITQRLSSDTLNEVRASAEPALHALGSFITFFAELLSTLVLAIFMLIFGGRIVGALIGESRPDRRARYEIIVQKVYRAVGGYTAGLGFICFVNGAVTTLFLAIAGVPFFLPFGIVSGISSLIPYAGPLTSAIGITLIVLVTKGAWTALATTICFACYGQIEGQILGPLVFRRTVHVSPLVTVLSILFFVEVGGVLGAVIAVPIAAAFQIVLKEILDARRERLRG